MHKRRINSCSSLRMSSLITSRKCCKSDDLLDLPRKRICASADTATAQEASSRYERCRQENSLMCIPPMETSFSHQNTSLSSEVKNPTRRRIFCWKSQHSVL